MRYQGTTTPFTLGVGSGEPLTTSVLLWTRLDPVDAAVAERDLVVEWEVAADPAFTQLANRGWATASAQDAHSIHLDVEDLEPDAPYWYRFRAGDHVSTVGRTRTLAPSTTVPSAWSLGATWGSAGATGALPALADLARAGLDGVIHLGGSIDATGAPTDLEGYRALHRAACTNPDVQAARASAPWYALCSALDLPAFEADPRGVARQGAYQAWWEHTPTRLGAPRGIADYVIYRQLWVGALLELDLIDQDQYATGAAAPFASLLGSAQETSWDNVVGDIGATWTALVGRWALTGTPGRGWDAYPAARTRWYRALTSARLGGGVSIHQGSPTEGPAGVLRADLGTPAASGVGAGWMRHDLTPTRWTAHARLVDQTTGEVVASPPTVTIRR